MKDLCYWLISFLYRIPMFIGHFAAGLAGKKLQPAISLATLFLASQFLDLLWPTLLLLGIEHVHIAPGISVVTPLDFADYPVSHSLVMVLVWSFLFGWIYQYINKNVAHGILVGLLVFSHWMLDLIVHIPDLPIYPGNSPKVGLGLWNFPVWTVVIEGLFFAGGIILYVQTKRALQEKLNGWFWGLMIFLVLIYIMNLFGPPPPDVAAIAWAGHLQWLFIPWAWWADRVGRR